jgi:hypothetical protein
MISPARAYLFGSDGIAIPQGAPVSLADGLLEYVQSRIEETSGFALLWPVEGFGSVTSSHYLSA